MSVLDFIGTPKYWFIINVIHAILLGPMLLYTGWTLFQDRSIPSTLKESLPYIGTLVLAYHSIRTYQTYTEASEQGATFSDMLGEYGFQVNLAHLLFIGPLIGWVGYKLSNGRAVTQLEKLLLIILGGAGTVYHSLRSYRKWSM